MGYLRRNFLPVIVGVAAILVAVAAVVVIVDRVRGEEEPQHVLRVGALRLDLDELGDALERLDFEDFEVEDLAELRDAIGALGLDELLGSLLGRLGNLSLPAAPVLGVNVEQDATGDGGGNIVRSVLPATPAARGGVEVGDEIVSVAGAPVDSVEALREALASLEPGNDYELVVDRDGERLTLAVERQRFVLAAGLGEALRGFLGDQAPRFSSPALPEIRPREPGEERRFFALPLAPAAPRLGVSAVDAADGVRVAEVVPGGGAEQAGLRAGDVISGVDGRAVASVEQLRERLRDFAPGETVAVTVLRDGQERLLSVTLSAPAEGVERRLRPGGLLEDRALPERGAVLERLAELVGGLLAAREGATAAGASPPAAEQPAQLMAYFGRVAAIDGDTVTLTGSEGSITLELTVETVSLGFKAAAIGDLVTAVTRGGIVELLIVVG